MNKEKVYYLAGAYSDEDLNVRDVRFERLTSLAALLVKEGYVVFSPVSYGHLLVEFEEMPVEFEFWKRFCLSLLSRCDEMIVLDHEGLDKSKGVAAEIEYCKENRIPYRVLSFDDILELFKVKEKKVEEEEEVVQMKVISCEGCPFLQVFKPTNDSPIIMNCGLNGAYANAGMEVEDKNIDPTNMTIKPDWCPLKKYGTVKIS